MLQQLTMNIIHPSDLHALYSSGEHDWLKINMIKNVFSEFAFSRSVLGIVLFPSANLGIEDLALLI